MKSLFEFLIDSHIKVYEDTKPISAYESEDEMHVLITPGSSESSGESVHSRRLARAFAARTHIVWT